MKKIVSMLLLALSSFAMAKDTSVMFDNSLPGQWESTIKISIDDGIIQESEKKTKKCVSKENIERANQKVLKESFKDEKGFQCKVSFKRESKTKGVFTSYCVGEEDGVKVLSNTKQSLTSEPKLNEVIIKTENRKESKPPLMVTTKIEIRSKWVGDTCLK